MHLCIYASGAISITAWRLEHATKIIMFLFEEIEQNRNDLFSGSRQNAA